MSKFNLAKTVRLQSKSDLLNWLRQNVQNGIISKEDLQSVVAEEGFFTKLQYVFTSDTRCAAKLQTTLSAIKKADEASLKAIASGLYFPTPKEADVMMKFIEIIFANSKPILDWFKKYESLIIKVEINGDGYYSESDRAKLNMARGQLIELLNTAGKNLAGKIRLDKARILVAKTNSDKDKTIGNIGYTKSNLYSTFEHFSSVIAGRKNLINTINTATMEISDEILKSSMVSDAARSFLDASLIANTFYKRLDYFGFYLSKKLC